MVAFFLSGSKDYFNQFLDDLEAAQALIEPEHSGEPLPMGRPLALVRATLSLELRGPPALHQGWKEFRENMSQPHPDVDKFTRVRFPIRLGEQDQLNDGLAVYWLENEGGSYNDNSYIIPNYDDAASAEDKKCDFLYQSIDEAPLKLTMLIDPRGVVHVASGIQPAKAIQIPPHQYAAALRELEMTFLTAPVLAGKPGATETDTISLPVTDPPGYSWSWLEKRGEAWNSSEISGADLFAPFAGPTQIREGWLTLATKRPPGLALSPVYGWTQDPGTAVRVSAGNTVLQGRLVCADAQDMIRQNHWLDPRYPRPYASPYRLVAKLPQGYAPLAGQDWRYTGRARWWSAYPGSRTLGRATYWSCTFMTEATWP
jgi:hypothetical protein